MKLKKIICTLTIVCLFFTNVYATSSTGPRINLKTTVQKVESGTLVKITADFSEPVIRFTRSEVSVDGGSVESVRKLGPSSFVIFARPTGDAKELDVQVESDKVQNTDKVYNELSSNEIVVKVSTQVQEPRQGSDSSAQISSLLDTVTKTINSQQQQTQTVQTAPVVQYVNCYGNYIPSTQVCVSPYTTTPVNNYYNPYSTYPSYGSYYNDYYSYPSTYYPSYNSGYNSWFNW